MMLVMTGRQLLLAIFGAFYIVAARCMDCLFNILSVSDDFADNLLQQFGPISGPIKCWASSGSNWFDTLIAFLKGSFLKT